MLKYNDVNSARNKYEHHPLFKQCIEIWCPIGWLDCLDKLVLFVEEYNRSCKENCRIAFGQVKIKFGMMTVYIQSLGNGSDLWSNAARDAGVYNFINRTCAEASKRCTFCGKELIEMVFNSKIRLVCMDHLPQRST